MYGSSINHGPKVAKLLMLFNYFDRLLVEIPTGTVTFERQVLNNAPNYTSLDVPLTNVDIKSKGSIEDSPEALQVDFANEFIGGASISYGCVQEEIRFSLCPECNVSRLFCERMNEKESIVIKGAVQFSSYEGYAYDLKYGGNYVDKNFDNTTGENLNHLVAMDALIFSSNQLSQWKKEKIDRELNKAFVAFNNTDRVISTGNWVSC
jgi:poly(ADP-ribose) glycohydrolase